MRSKSDKKKPLVPRLRFPEFREAVAWEEKEVGEIFKVTRGEVLSMRLVSDMPSETTPYPVYSSQTKNNGLSGYYSDFLYENAITWTTDGANAGDVNYRPGKFYCTNVCGVLINNDGYANVFIAELLNTITRKHVSYIGNPKLMNGVMAKIKIILPPLPEQQKIAHCLSSLDEVIGLQAKKVQALKQHKKSLMQQLFPAEGETTPRLRFPEFREAGAWEVKRLGEVANISMGASPKSASYNDQRIGLPLIQGNADIKDRKSSPRLFASQITRECWVGDILVGVRAPVGMVAKSEHHACIGRGISALCVKGEDRQEFLYQWLLWYEPHWVSISQGGTFDSVNKNEITNLVALFPNPSEQQKIAHCLSSLDEVIGLESHKLDALKNLKKGLMQQLFPQEVA